MSAYDVIVIGGGPGGYNAAIRAGQLGLKVACVEGRETLGGTCLNVGCMPSKALLHASELYEAAAGGEFANLGIQVKPKLDLAQMMKQKAESVTALTKGVEFLFRKNKVDWVKGWGRIDGPGKVEVTAADGSKSSLTAKDIIIATGSEPSPLPGVEVDNKRILDSTGALSIPEVPKHLVVIGAGVIGLELGSVWRRLGAEVTVIEYLDRLPRHGPGNRQDLPARADQAGHELQAGLESHPGQGQRQTGDAERGAGCWRRGGVDPGGLRIARHRPPPLYAGLGLESVGLATDKRGMLENHEHRSSVPGIWVIGDVTSGPMLAHKAEDEAIACVELIAGKAGEVNYDVIPSVIYTHPEVATVGKTEEQLKAEGRAYKVGKFPFTANSRAKINHETEGFVKVLADERSDEILGVHMIGPNVGDMIAEYCVAMEFRGAAEDIARTCHPHPTRSEALRQAAMNVDGWAMQA